MVSGWINSGSRCYGVEKSVFRSFSGSAHAMAWKVAMKAQPEEKDDGSEGGSRITV